MLDSPPSTISTTTVSQSTQSSGKKRKGEAGLSQLLSKAKRMRGTPYTDRLDEVERYLSNNHCESAT
jgi:hypothetical protein